MKALVSPGVVLILGTPRRRILYGLHPFHNSQLSEILLNDNGDGTFGVNVTWELKSTDEFAYIYGHWTLDVAIQVQNILLQDSPNNVTPIYGGEFYNAFIRATPWTKILV